MNESYDGSSASFVSDKILRATEAPENATRVSKPKKSKMTAATYEGIRQNKETKKLAKKIDKYNREFAELQRLANETNESIGTNDYSAVMQNVELYNKQARRLAKIGVQVLAFDSEAYKVIFEKKQAARAIKVPAFLIGPLKMLSAEGRRKAAELKKVKAEKERLDRKMVDTIVSTAEAAIGEHSDDGLNVDYDKISALSLGNLSELSQNGSPTGESATTAEEAGKGSDEKEKTDQATPVVTEPTPTDTKSEEDKKKEEEEARKAAEEQAKAEKRDKVNAAMQKKRAARQKAAVDVNDTFAFLSKISNSFVPIKYQKVKDGKKVVGKAVKSVGATGTSIVSAADFNKIGNINSQNSEEIRANYREFVNLVDFAYLWRNSGKITKINRSTGQPVADGEDINSSLVVDQYHAFDEENRVVFDFVVNAVNGNMSNEEALAKAKEELSEEQVAFVEKLVSDPKKYETIKKGVSALDKLGVSVKKTSVDEDVMRKRRLVDKGMAERAKKKYGWTDKTDDKSADDDDKSKDTDDKGKDADDKGTNPDSQDDQDKKDDQPAPVVTPKIVTPVVGIDDKSDKNDAQDDQTKKDDQDKKDDQPTPVVTPDGVDKTSTEDTDSRVYPKPVDDKDYISQISALTRDISRLLESRNSLVAGLGAEAEFQGINELISNKLNQINRLALSGIVALGTTSEKGKDDTATKVPPVVVTVEASISKDDQAVKDGDQSKEDDASKDDEPKQDDKPVDTADDDKKDDQPKEDDASKDDEPKQDDKPVDNADDDKKDDPSKDDDTSKDDDSKQDDKPVDTADDDKKDDQSKDDDTSKDDEPKQDDKPVDNTDDDKNDDQSKDDDASKDDEPKQDDKPVDIADDDKKDDQSQDDKPVDNTDDDKNDDQPVDEADKDKQAGLTDQDAKDIEEEAEKSVREEYGAVVNVHVVIPQPLHTTIVNVDVNHINGCNINVGVSVSLGRNADQDSDDARKDAVGQR